MVALARSAVLAGSGFPVYGVHEGPWAPAATSRYLRGSFFWQSALSDTERICAGLLQLARQIGRPPVLIPTDEAGAIFPLERGSGLLEAFLVPGPPGTPVVVSTEHSIGETQLERRRMTRGVRYLRLSTATVRRRFGTQRSRSGTYRGGRGEPAPGTAGRQR